MSGLTGKQNTVLSEAARIARGVAAGFLVVSFAVPASSAVFSVTPVRMYMKPQDRAIAVTISNDGDEEVVIQADVFSWKQKPGGEDDLAPTEDLIVSPPIIKVPPKSRQVIRLARVRAIQSGDQVTYRVVAREIPEAVAAGKDIQLRIALAFSMPVFITPPTAKAKLECSIERASPDTVRAVCENTGNAYAQPRDFLVNAGGGEKLAQRDSGGYILPGVKRSFDIKRSDGRIPSGKVKLLVTLDDAAIQSFELTVPD